MTTETLVNYCEHRILNEVHEFTLREVSNGEILAKLFTYLFLHFFAILWSSLPTLTINLENKNHQYSPIQNGQAS